MKYYMINGQFYESDELYHWGIKGMKWGVRRYQNPDGSLTNTGKKRYWTAEPEGYSIKHQIKEQRLKTAIKTEKDRTKKRQLKQQYKETVALGKQKAEEYMQFEKDMHAKVGKTSKLKISKNTDGTYTYANKKGEKFKKYEVDGARGYEASRSCKRARAFSNACLAGSLGLMSVAVLGTLRK